MSERAADLWHTFAGMFGADAIERRFGANPPGEWINAVGRLTQFEFERGLRALERSGMASVPSLPQFMRLCKQLGEDSDRRQTRPPELPFDGDRWTIIANQRLLKHIMTQASRGNHYCSVHDRSVPVPRLEHWQADAETHALTQPLVDYKNAWAQDMREGPHPLSQQIQDDAWRSCMHRAEELINKVRTSTTQG